MHVHALYFIAYAVMATVTGLVIAQAQYSRMKTEGTPMNLGFLKATGAVAAFMWAAAGITNVAYTLAA